MQQLSKVQICQTEQKIKESNMTVEKPRLIKQNRYLDFGFGFYTTTNRDQAVNFAQKVTERRKTGKATLNIYSVDEKVAFEECSLLRFDNPDEIWLDFVAENRQGTYQEKQYVTDLLSFVSLAFLCNPADFLPDYLFHLQCYI